MSKMGKELEHLVYEIEKALVPHAMNVELNDRVFNEEGIQVAEFDIKITGNLGSSSINWLIECRDRPSEGPAPGSWIEQLVGRRKRFNFDKVIAVSTTGFVDGVKNFAKQEGILLRTVETITEIASDFEIVNLPWKMVRVDILSDLLNIGLENHQDRKYLGVQKFYQIKFPNEKNFYHIKDFITKVIRNHSIVANAKVDIKKQLNFEFIGHADVRIENEHIVKISKFRIPIQLIVKFFQGDALAIKAYAEENRVIGKEVAFRINLDEGKICYRVLLMDISDNEQIIKLYYPDEIPKQYGRIRLETINFAPPE